MQNDSSSRPDYFGDMRARHPRWNVERERDQAIAAAGYSVERYKSRPDDAPASPPNHLGGWPTGFAGTGWLVRGTATGEILFAHAFRVECFNWIGPHLKEAAATREP